MVANIGNVKFNRNYRLTIQNLDDTQVIDLQGGGSSTANLNPQATVIEYPITCMFSIKRGITSSPNSLDIQIYNLSETTRKNIFQDRGNYFSSSKGNVTNRKIILEAGYGDKLYEVFRGNIFEAGSTRRGPDILTYINARDGAYDTNLAQAFQTISAPVTKKQLIEVLAAQFPNLKIGAIADDGITFNRPVACSGNVWETIKTYCGKDAFIDLEKVYYLRDFDIIEEQDIVIDATSGLLDTPNRQDAGLFVTTLFEPTAAIGRAVQLKSTIMPEYDGRYKIGSIAHDCTMSGSVGGESRTTLGLIIEGQVYGRQFQPVPVATTRNETR